LADKKKEKKEDPSFFAIIPATIRYDKSLSPNAKLLYGELTALCKKEGYSWATNKYFANLYQVDRSSISHWIKKLEEAGYIRIEIIYDQAQRYIEERRIFLTGLALEKPVEEYVPEAASEEEQEEQTADEMNNYSENGADSEGGGEKFHQGGEIIHQGVVKNFTRGGEKTPQSINTFINKSSSSDLPEIEKPPPDEEEEENDSFKNFVEEKGFQTDPLSRQKTDPPFDAHSLKQFLRQLGPSFVFSEPFYQKASGFLSHNRLDYDYIFWLYEFCTKQRPKNIENYFYKVFFDERCAELYLENSKPPPLNAFNCPICSAEHDSSLSTCPVCGFESSYRHDKEKISRYRILFKMPVEVKKAYDEELSNIIGMSKELNIRERNNLLKSLDLKYGLPVY